MCVLTIEAGEVGPVKQRAVKGGDGQIVEQVCAIGVAQCVAKQVHLEQRFDQVAQHLGSRNRRTRCPSIPVFLSDVCSDVLLCRKLC